ncbi:MAG: inositol monophosphatase family protein [Pseudomonadota bacterium]
MQPMANIALRAARTAADFIAQSFDRPDERNIQTKARNDFVSDVDQNAERIIIDAISQTYPDHAILAEESCQTDRDSEYTWIIDPLDGTLNFLQGIPHFAVSIGIMRGKHLEHGVIVDPIRNEEFVASRGYGAQLNGKRIRVSNRHKLEDCVLGTGIPPGSVQTRLTPYMQSLNTLTGTCRGMRRAGSAALDLAYVAAGRLDGFWEMGLSRWDIAAGIVLIREAGGFVGDFSGGENYWQSGDIVTANPKTFRHMVQILKANPG